MMRSLNLQMGKRRCLCLRAGRPQRGQQFVSHQWSCLGAKRVRNNVGRDPSCQSAFTASFDHGKPKSSSDQMAEAAGQELLRLHLRNYIKAVLDQAKQSPDSYQSKVECDISLLGMTLTQMDGVCVPSYWTVNR